MRDDTTPEGASIATAADTPASAGALRCQWCSVPLDAGVTTCPTCGSPGIPDPRLDPPAAAETPARDANAAAQPTELVEWWREEDEEATRSRKPLLSPDDADQRRMMTLAFIGSATVICVAAGWLAGPLLAGVMENMTGMPVENTSDLRPTGAFLGLLAGFFVGALGGWMIWETR